MASNEPTATTDRVDMAALPPLDLDTLTLGEMADVERASGQSFTDLLAAGRATRALLALYIHESRTSERPRSWRELASLRPFDGSRSTLRSSRAGRSATSND